ncbi:nascent polypeptide-associated complex subunit alpha, muscle-specific form isoform X2 [Dunckerocampus dactyliophorus]|uniref:nascent polypeptide-associated complex subunit alpha, muscle-specific form isoform X2 n=1 Tax=Dunckerocampus dactyliophorus TaxID=161453 RepID=UPI0024057603|nr:nascent polypeptide-associated complex subunit alpha, muscle-specific form isoform X2 [Dunckerocampus dactyliophorus]
MEKNYPVLKRPKRKLCYLPSIQNSRKENWGPKLSLGDVDRMFDDLDCVSDVDAPPVSSMLEDCEESQELISASPVALRRASRPAKCQTPPREAQLSPATQSLSPELHIHLPLKGHGPVKTSSPIEVGREAPQTESNEELSPILFDCQEAEARTQPPSGKKANKDVTEKHLHSDFESPPSLVVLCKHTSSLKNRMAEPPNSPYREPQVPSPEESTTAKMSGQVKKDMATFLQKLRDAGQPKATVGEQRKKKTSINNLQTCFFRVRKSLAPIKPPSEPEDDFLIVEDEVPFRFSILSKSTTTPQRSKRSSSDKDSSTDKGSKGGSPERTPKQPSADVSRRKPLKDPTVGQKATKREKKKNTAGTGGDKVPSPDDIPAAEPLPRDMSSKKKARPREKVLPDTAEEQQKEPARRQTDDEKAQTSSGVRRLKSSKPSRDNLKTSRPAGKVKGIRQKPSSKERANLASPSDLTELNIDPVQDLAAGKPEQNKHLGSGGSSEEEAKVLGKRKRNPPGEWWLSCPQNTEQLTDQPPSVKKSKQGEPSTAVPSPTKADKERPFKRTSKDSKKTNGAKVKQKKRLRGDTTDTIEVNRDEAEQMDAQEQEAAQQEPLLSSPLELNHRDQSHNSEHQQFQRVYQHPGRKKVSHTPVSLSPRGSLEQLSRAQASKRNRKPPGEWWKATSTPEDTESSQPEPLRRMSKKAHARKERKTGSKQRTPAAGGALVSPLTKRVLWVPKSIKSSMGTFKDIFSSHTENTVVLRNGDTDQNNEVQSPDRRTPKNTHQATVGIDVGQAHHGSPQDYQNTFSILRSGPSSMIDLEMHKDTGPSLSSPFPAELSVCDMCAPPLKPFVLQAKDKANLTRWLRILWSTTLKSKKSNNASKFSPDHFDWYTHRGRVMGVLEDLHCGNISHGKMLLGSFMRKPLWVDHSATTIFNLQTSSINVTINCTESCVHAGQSFMVPCGHAYSIQNLVAQPVMLCFTRVLAESPD